MHQTWCTVQLTRTKTANHSMSWWVIQVELLFNPLCLLWKGVIQSFVWLSRSHLKGKGNPPAGSNILDLPLEMLRQIGDHLTDKDAHSCLQASPLMTRMLDRETVKRRVEKALKAELTKSKGLQVTPMTFFLHNSEWCTDGWHFHLFHTNVRYFEAVLQESKIPPVKCQMSKISFLQSLIALSSSWLIDKHECPRQWAIMSGIQLGSAAFIHCTSFPTHHVLDAASLNWHSKEYHFTDVSHLWKLHEQKLKWCTRIHPAIVHACSLQFLPLFDLPWDDERQGQTGMSTFTQRSVMRLDVFAIGMATQSLQENLKDDLASPSVFSLLNNFGALNDLTVFTHAINFRWWSVQIPPSSSLWVLRMTRRNKNVLACTDTSWWGNWTDLYAVSNSAISYQRLDHTHIWQRDNWGGIVILHWQLLTQTAGANSAQAMFIIIKNGDCF